MTRWRTPWVSPSSPAASTPSQIARARDILVMYSPAPVEEGLAETPRSEGQMISGALGARVRWTNRIRCTPSCAWPSIPRHR